MQALIKNYQPSEETLGKFKGSNFVVLAGPAAAGKDTLRNGLLRKYPNEYVSIVSTTSRKPRKNEIEGETYHFASEDAIYKRATEKKLLQIALVDSQQLSALDSLELDKLTDKIGLSILVVQTERELFKLNPSIKTIFLIPPSYGELIRRLEEERITKQHESSRRLTAAKSEIRIALDTSRYFCIISDEKARVVDLVHLYLAHDKFDTEEDKRARKIMQNILREL